MERTLRITGTGKLSIKPDLITIFLTIQNLKKDYDELLKTSAKATNEIKNLLEEVGFKKDDIKTISFNIDTEYDSYRDELNNYIKKFKGFCFTHKMKIQFEANNKTLGQVLYALSKCKSNPTFSIVYTVSNPEEYKNQLLENAITDSKEKALVIAKASNVQLGDILSIDYSWGELDIYAVPFNSKRMILDENCSTSYELDINVDDIDVSDTITVVWNIK